MNKKSLSYPYLLWMAILIVVPLLLVLFFAFTVKTGEGYTFSLANLEKFFQPMFLKVFWKSVELALKSTIICILLGYPVALILADSKFSHRNTMLILIILPMWMNLLLRTYAWMTLLENNGIINQFIKMIGFEPVQFMYNEQAIILGMVYNFLPFMILPIYAVLIKIDKSIIEAAKDLGANDSMVFKKIILPLSLGGVISGTMMVFMPSLSTFIIPRLMSGGKISLIGNIIEQQFLVVGDWHFGSFMAFILMLIIFLSMIFLGEDKIEGGGVL